MNERDLVLKNMSSVFGSGRIAMRKDYYVVLGISKTADLNKIKKAYRAIVKDYHPDTGHDTGNSEKFKEATEAYETLADEEKRRKYDRELNRQGMKPVLAPETNVMRDRSLYIEIENDFSGLSFMDDFFGGFVHGFFDHEGKTRKLEKDLYLEVVLSPEEALTGGMIPMSVPVAELCQQCARLGKWERFFCNACFGKGTIESRRHFSLAFPPHTADGSQIRISLEDIGLKDTNLYLTVTIDPFMDFF